jgi:hypothetical protein
MTLSKTTTGTCAIPGLGAAGAASAIFVPIDSLYGWKENPRRIPEAAVREVLASMKRFGFGTPVLARSPETPELIAGHVRILAAERGHAPVVPCRWMNHLSEGEAHALAVADNQLSTKTRWDAGLLRDVMQAWAAGGNDAHVLGFSDKQIARHLDDAPGVHVIEVEVSKLRDQFYLSVRGPVPEQAEALERLKTLLSELPGCMVEVGIVHR